MRDQPELMTAALLATSATTASTLFGMYDLFASVGRDWEFLMSGTPGAPRIRPVIAAAGAGPFRAANGVMIEPQATFADLPAPDVICVPDLFVAPNDDLPGDCAAATPWLAACGKGGSIVASACSGALLLAEAGLLDGLEATTHWGYCEALGRRYPSIRVCGARALVASGEGQRIITAGGGTSWQDLALFLVARFFGAEEAMRIARIYLMDWHSAGQLPFSAVSKSRQFQDKTISTCQAWIADNYTVQAPVNAMAELSGLPERSFKRRFTKATGMSPMEYVHTLRLEEAKQILETTEDPVEAVANEVGYEDGSFFRRLFRRQVGLSPAEYRKRFGGMRKALPAR